MTKNLYVYTCLALALICATGSLLSWENLLGTHDQLLGIGAALMLLHAAFNPELIRNPIEANTIMKGKLQLVGKAGILFLILGVIETMGDWTPTTYIQYGQVSESAPIIASIEAKTAFDLKDVTQI